MMRGRSLLAVGLGAVLAVLLNASATVAASWLDPVPVQDHYAWTGDLCVTRDGVVVATTDFRSVFVERSGTNGTTWRRTARRITDDVWPPEMACRGRHVDLAYSASYDGAWYARSRDGGRTFGPTRRLSSTEDGVGTVDVARGPGAVVAVAWDATDDYGFPQVEVDVRLRVSTDGGATFGPVRTIPNASGPAIAVGDGVIYLAYLPEGPGPHVAVRRSTDGGRTWSESEILTTRLWGRSLPTLVAREADAYIGYVNRNQSTHWAVYRRTTDRGSTWSGPMLLTPIDGKPVEDIHFGISGDTLAVAYTQCRDYWCQQRVRSFYRETENGLAWSPAQLVTGGYSTSVDISADRAFVGITKHLGEDPEPRPYVSVGLR